MQICVAAHSGEFNDDLVNKTREFLRALRDGHCDLTLMLGGYWGLMRVVVDEALKLNMKVVVVLPIERENEELPDAVIKVRSGCDYKCRSMMLVRSCDALVALGGGVGTIIEVLASYAMGKPTYVITNTGLATDALTKAFPEYVDERRTTRIRYLDDPRQVASELSSLCSRSTRGVMVEFG